ncbi:hypothetical protein V2J09_010423 [Rumex salicifolius]
MENELPGERDEDEALRRPSGRRTKWAIPSKQMIYGLKTSFSAMEEPESLIPGIFEIPGEPAVLINGVPDIPPSQDLPTNSNITPETDQPRCTGFGEWLEGREVKKQFGEQYYSGMVTEYDRESGWYRVVYEDGDFEDLEWQELKDVLEPLDISIPLKNLALKIIKKSEKPDFLNAVGGVSSSKSAKKTNSRRRRKK